MIYGYDSLEPLVFRAVPNTAGLFYQPSQSTEINVEEALKSMGGLPQVPPVVLKKHWLAIEGVQPITADNPTPADAATGGLVNGSLPGQQSLVTPPSVGPPSKKELQEDAEIKALARHSLSRELQLLYDGLVEAMFGTLKKSQQATNGEGDGQHAEPKDKSDTWQAALKIIGEEAGVQPLLPYLVQLAAETMLKWTGSLLKPDDDQDSNPMYGGLIAVRILSAIINNRTLFPEPYLHQMMPVLLTAILVDVNVNEAEKEGLLGVRREAAVTLSTVIGLYGEVYPTLLPRVCKTLSDRLPQTEKTSSGNGSVAGALLGLMALGKHALISCLTDAHREALHAIPDATVQKLYLQAMSIIQDQ